MGLCSCSLWLVANCSFLTIQEIPNKVTNLFHKHMKTLYFDMGWVLTPQWSHPPPQSLQNAISFQLITFLTSHQNILRVLSDLGISHHCEI